MIIPVAPETRMDVAAQAAPVAASSSVATGTAKVPAIARFLPSLTDLAFMMPIIFVFVKLAGARTLLGDGDTGWHIRTGQWILAHHMVPTVDMFSYSRPGAPWFAWEWLWDVCFAVLFSKWGMPSVVLGSMAVICFTNALLFRLVRRKCGNGLVAIAVTLLATGGCAIHWLARPHLFTLLFFVVSMHITERAREGRTRLLAWLVPLTLLWTNLHGGFFVLFLLLACYIGGDLLNAVLERDPVARRGYLAAVKPWLLTFVVCFAVTFINPYGWQLHKHVIEYISDPYQLQHITEFQSMNFHSPVVVYFEPLMAVAFFVALWDLRNRRFVEVFASMGWLHLALMAQRNLPLFALAVAPEVARGISAVLGEARLSNLASWIPKVSTWFVGAAASTDETDRIPRVHLVSAMAVAIIGLLLFAPAPLNDKFISTYDPAYYPEKALSLLSAPDVHHIFAEDEWGDYLVYQLYPKGKKVFIDGRSDFYGDDFGERYLDLMNVKWDWQSTLDKYSVDTIAISPKFALTQTLKISPDWRVVYDDTVTVVFRRNQSQPVPFVSSNEGSSRDRKIAKTTTQPNT